MASTSFAPTPSSPSSSGHGIHVPTRLPITKYVVSPTTTHYRGIVPYLRTAAGLESLLRLTQYTIRLLIFLRPRHELSLRRQQLIKLLTLVGFLSGLRRVLGLLDLGRNVGGSLRGLLGALRDRKGKGRERRNGNYWRSEVVVEGLDGLSTIADNLHLLATLSLLPHPLTTSQFYTLSKVSSFLPLLSSLLSYTQLNSLSHKIQQTGRSLHSEITLLEKDLKARDQVFFIEMEETDLELEKRGEEKRRLREVVRGERRRLKGLRERLNAIWWEKMRRGAEGVFAAVDTLEIKFGEEGVRSISGIVSASILFSQTWSEYLRS